MDRPKDWFEQAERDLGFGKTAAGTGHQEWAAFLAQQSAEKAVKALVHALRGAVRGHSITEIPRSLPLSVSVSQEVLEGAQALDKVYVTSRYPNGFASERPGDYFNGTDSEDFLDHARGVDARGAATTTAEADVLDARQTGGGDGNAVDAVATRHAMIFVTTSPATSVRRKSRPWNLYVSRV